MSMSATSPAKFAFDLDLGQAKDKTRIIGEYALADLLKKAEHKGYAQGLIDGEQTTTATAAKALSDDASALIQQATDMEEAADRMQRQNLADATQLGIIVARKLAGNMIARTPLGEIKNLISECLSSLDGVPHLVIRCHPDLADAVQKEAESQMKISGFSGRLVVMGEPEISLGDARLEWVDGGLVRDISEISSQIDTCIGTFLNAHDTETTQRAELEGTEQ